MNGKRGGRKKESKIYIKEERRNGRKEIMRNERRKHMGNEREEENKEDTLELQMEGSKGCKIKWMNVRWN